MRTVVLPQFQNCGGTTVPKIDVYYNVATYLATLILSDTGYMKAA